MLRGIFFSLFAFSLFAVRSPESASAGDWPQIFGPNRNGVAVGETIADSWPDRGPKVVWQKKIGAGFSGVAVARGIAILFHRLKNDEVVQAFDAKSGRKLWSTRHPTDYASPYSPDKGPRCTPLIHRGFVYVYGAQGVLRCLRIKDGAERWTRFTHKDFGAPAGYFGAGSTPIIEGENILVNVGSRNGAGIVAFALKTGQTVWKISNEYASYSSPTAVTVNGTRHLLFVTRMKLISLDPTTGKVRFSFPFGKRGPTVNGASPVVLDGHLFLSAHYGIGAVYAKIGKTKADVIWKSNNVMSSQYMTCIERKGLLFGIHGQERVDAAELRCFDPKTRKVYWTRKGLGFGTLMYADGKFLALNTTGELILFKADAAGYRELARARIFRNTTRALPALANGLLYLHDSNTLKCLDLRKKH